jgi:hypothetical protein
MASAAFAVPAPLGRFLPVVGQPPMVEPPLSPQEQAHAVVDAFAARGAGGLFVHILRADVARGLHDRIDKPTLIDQGASSLCGPSALTLNVATHNPVAYVKFVIALYERGVGDIQRLHIKAGKDLRDYDPAGNVAAADWIPIASIRDSENYFFDYQSSENEFAGITLPRELEDWFRKIGYSRVVNETNLLTDQNEKNIREADRLYKDDYWVCLLINDKLLYPDKQDSGSMVPTHWVVLTSDVKIAGGNISFEVFSWGNGQYQVPHGKAPLTLDHFFDVYYGYVAAKY